MTLNSWRNYRDAEGYVTKEVRQAARFGNKKLDSNPPCWVKVVPRAKLDVLTLMNLTSSRDPPDIPVQAKKEEAVYLVGDASGTGMGSVFWVQGGKLINAEF